MLHLLGVEREQAGVLKCLAHGRDVVGGFLTPFSKSLIVISLRLAFAVKSHWRPVQ